MSNTFLKTLCAALLGITATACGTGEEQTGANERMAQLEQKDGSDIQQALSALNGARVLGTNEKDGVPFYVTGRLGTARGSALGVAPADAKASVQDALTAVAPVFRTRAENLVFKRVTVDESGQHLRFQQTKNGLAVVNGELIVHVDNAGTVYAVNGDARDTQAGLPQQTQPVPHISAEAAAVAAGRATSALNQSARTERLVYVRDVNDQLVLAHEVRVTGVKADGTPVNDLVYVNADNSRIALVAPQLHTALNRKVYTANNGSSTPGTLVRSEGQAPVSDTIVNQNYDALGATYNCYKTLFNRDSFDNAGATYISTVHYSSNYVNAYWDGTQMVYGDGDGVNSSSLATDKDVTTHELTHAVTERTSNLTYSGESGGLNESMSDTFAAICQSWENAWSTAPEIWMIGEAVWTPATPNDALRYMDDPAKDGVSLDWYPDYGGQDVHYSSGISNLAFALLSKGGTHPRNKSTTVVTGIGVQQAAQIWYKANTSLFTASTTFAQAKTYTEQAASQLGYAQSVIDSVTAAWQAVGVGIVIPPPPTTPLTNNVPVTGLSGGTNAKAYYKLTVPAGQSTLTFTTSGGTGDADLYVKFGAAPTTSAYDCRPYTAGNSETCTFTNPAAGDWYVMLNGYAAYSGLTLTGAYSVSSGGGGGGTLTNGVATAPYSGASGSMTCFTLSVPAGKTSLVFNQAGATGTTGDGDLYVRFGTAPTTTTYDCRPYSTGNTESCTFSAPASGTWYACTRGYSAYSNVTMKGTYK